MTMESRHLPLDKEDKLPNSRLEKSRGRDFILSVANPEEGHEDEEGNDVVNNVNKLEISYPILVIPWGENYGENYHATQNDAELKAAVQSVLRKSGNERRIHVISIYPQKYKSGEYPSEATIK